MAQNRVIAGILPKCLRMLCNKRFPFPLPNSGFGQNRCSVCRKGRTSQISGPQASPILKFSKRSDCARWPLTVLSRRLEPLEARHGLRKRLGASCKAGIRPSNSYAPTTPPSRRRGLKTRMENKTKGGVSHDRGEECVGPSDLADGSNVRSSRFSGNGPTCASTSGLLFTSERLKQLR